MKLFLLKCISFGVAIYSASQMGDCPLILTHTEIGILLHIWGWYQIYHHVRRLSALQLSLCLYNACL